MVRGTFYPTEAALLHDVKYNIILHLSLKSGVRTFDGMRLLRVANSGTGQRRLGQYRKETRTVPKRKED